MTGPEAGLVAGAVCAGDPLTKVLKAAKKRPGHLPISLHALVGILICPSRVRAIAVTLPLGSVGYEAEVGANGDRLIWLAPAYLGERA